MSTAQEIRRLRKQLHMNQHQLAEALGSSQGSVSKWESGKEEPRAETLDRIRAMVRDRNNSRSAGGGEAYQQIWIAPVMGMIVEGSSMSLQSSGEEQPKVAIPVDSGWREESLEAWSVMGHFPHLPTLFLGIFAKISPKDRIDDFMRKERFLVEFNIDGKNIGAIMSLYGSNTKGWSLWPDSDQAKQKIQPIKIGEDGMIDEKDAIVRGVFIGVYHKVGTSKPEDTEDR